jgi:hypothetical protein
MNVNNYIANLELPNLTEPTCLPNPAGVVSVPTSIPRMVHHVVILFSFPLMELSILVQNNTFSTLQKVLPPC